MIFIEFATKQHFMVHGEFCVGIFLQKRLQRLIMEKIFVKKWIIIKSWMRKMT